MLTRTDDAAPALQEVPIAGGRLSRADLPTYDTECRWARTQSYDVAECFLVTGGSKGYVVRIVERDGAWTTRHDRW